MTITRNETRHQFTRGAEIMRHEYGLYFSALFFSFLIALLTSLGTWVFSANAALSEDEGSITLGRIVAEFNVRTGKPADKVKMEFKRGEDKKVYVMPASVLLESTQPEWVEIKRKLWWCFWFALAAGIGLFFLINWVWRQFGKNVGKDVVIRGAVFAKAKDVTKELLKKGEASAIRLAGVPIPKGKETLNVGISGAIGTGKSQAISSVLEDLRATKQRAIIFDSTGDYIKHFYREGLDVILNPFDVRSPDWAPWNEARKPYDYANLSESFIPVMNRREPFWEEGGQAVLEDILSRLAKNGQATNRRLVEVVNTLTLKEIQEIVKKLPAAVYMDPDAAKTALGIRMNVVRAAKAMRYLSDGSPENQFSIRDWVLDDRSDSWLFLSTKEDMLATMRPLLTAWIDIAARAIMSRKPNESKLIWKVVDELTSLNRISMLSEAIARGRKYGMCCILGYQNIAQMRECYGDNDAQTIISQLRNRIALCVPDFQTAEYVSNNLGSQEIYEKDENISYGQDSTRDGVTISTSREENVLVLPSEIQGLEDMHGYVRLAGRNEVMKVEFDYKQRALVADPFIEKEEIPYALDE
jgi:type IV conjugative transfer system coupling protein TraD